MIFSRSSTAIWWVSRSDSFASAARIRDLSSTMATWDERPEEEEEQDWDLEEEEGLESLEEGLEVEVAI